MDTIILLLTMEREILEKIEKNTTNKPAFQIVLTGIGSKLSAEFTPPLDFRIGCKYEIALASLETYRSFPNIDNSNNEILILINGIWEKITIAIGCYDIRDINNEIKRQIGDRGGTASSFNLTPNLNTLKCIMTLSDGIEVNLKGDKSIRTVLGFEPKIFKNGRHESKNVVDIMKVNSILVHCNVIGQSYLNGSQQPIIYSFFPNSLVGEKIIERPNTLIYLPIDLDVIRQLTCYLTDQNQKLLDLRGEKLTIKFHIRAC